MTPSTSSSAQSPLLTIVPATLLRRNAAACRLAILAQMEYRFNFLVDAFFQPIILIAVEGLLWWSIFSASGQSTINGYPRESYLSYVIWAGFFGRLSANWMYESRMCREVELGTINTILTRPITFYEYYLSQFIGYKSVVALSSITIPLIFSWALRLPVLWSNLPVALTLLFFYLVFTYTISFCMASAAFFTTRISGFTGAKNIMLWLLCGETFPLDLLPPNLAHVMLSLPFCAGVYLPISLLTGRQSLSVVPGALLSLTLGTLFFGLIGRLLWKRGVASYVGTGA